MRVSDLLTTQNLEEADELAHRIAVLDGGRIVATGTPSQLKAAVGVETVEVKNDAGDVLREIHTDGTVGGLRRALDLADGALPRANRGCLRRPR